MLDADVGQAEFTPGGMVSVTSVSRPLLGPPHTHPVGVGSGADVLYATLMGDVTPESDPDRYMACVASVCEFVHRRAAAQGVPVLVNTCGWVKGLGLELLTQLLAISGASLVLVCQVPTPAHPSTLDPQPSAHSPQPSTPNLKP